MLCRSRDQKASRVLKRWVRNERMSEEFTERGKEWEMDGKEREDHTNDPTVLLAKDMSEKRNEEAEKERRNERGEESYTNDVQCCTRQGCE